MSVALCLMGAVLAAPGHALAANSDEDEVKHDSRTEGYAKTVQVESNGTSLTWLLFIVLTVVAMAGLFKDAKRTHLD